MTKSENVEKVVLHLEKEKLVSKASRSQPIIGVTTQSQVKDDLKKVTVLVNCLYDLLKIYGYDDKKVSRKKLKGGLSEIEIIKSQTKKTIEDKLRLRNEYLKFVFSSGHGSWKDLFKYKINAYFSFVMQQEIPPVPKGLEKHERLLNPSFMFFGRAKRFVSKLNLNEKTKISLAQSIAQSKKGAPPVSEEMVSEAEFKCFEHLSTPREDIPPFILDDRVFEHVINRDTMKYQLRRTVRELFGKKVPLWEDLAKPFVPSTNSNYNFSRNKLGGVGAFKFNGIGSIDGPLIRKGLGPVKLVGELTTLYGKAGISDQEKLDQTENLVKETIGLCFDTSRLDEHWKNVVYEDLLNAALKELPKTIVIGLPEPLKVRCITAGPPLTYAFLKPMQKWLWKILKSYSCFQLIGTPVTPEIVKNQFGRLGEKEEFISGDYKASTDNLHSWVSEALLEAFDEIWEENKVEGDKFSERKDEIVSLMKRALTGHIILDPRLTGKLRKDQSCWLTTTADEDYSEDSFREQKEGQLMGSIISFIFLCLANAAMCRWAMEITEKKNLSLRNKCPQGYDFCRLLINGDDCAFPANRKYGFDNWKDITSFGGLESSVGKTFRSRKFLTINSVQYQLNISVLGWEEDSGMASDYEYEEIKYVNLGLVYGQKKDGIRNKHFYNLGAVHRDLKNTCPPEYFSRATKIFLREAKRRKYITIYEKGKKPRIVEDPFGSILNAKVPYYLPEWLGGLGFVAPDNEIPVSEWDLKVAGVIRGKRIPNLEARHLGDLPFWQFDKLFSKYIEDYSFLSDQHYKYIEKAGIQRELGQEFQELYSKVVVEILLTTPLLNLVKDVSEQKEIVLRENHLHNQKIWRILRSPEFNQLVYSEPLPDYADLLQEKKSFFLSCFNVTPGK